MTFLVLHVNEAVNYDHKIVINSIPCYQGRSQKGTQGAISPNRNAASYC